ncbi:MAG: hypothetical protein JWR18_1301 [Segetibacter sp.]|nr:hypothetical protein [Segetibacter sp.]
MESVELRQKLHHYIENAEEKKLQAIFTIFEDETNEYYDHWHNEELLMNYTKENKHV